jgi:beta-glucosidase
MFCLGFIVTFVLQWLLVCAQNESIISKDTYFYGQSPLVPLPLGTGVGNWSAAYAKAKAFVAQLSLDEKINFTAGVTADNGCSG